MTSTTDRELVRLPARVAEPTDVRAALRALWQDSDTEGVDTARAVTINFIGVTKHPRDQDDPMRAAADDLVRRSPARVFLLHVDDSLQEPSVEVSATMRQRGNTRFVIAEEIHVQAPGNWFSHVPGLVRPLLIHDLPTHVFWADDWDDRERFAAMRRLGDHCLVDTQRFTLPAVQLPELADARATGRRITDLNWLRLRPWRRALAEAFERIRWRSDSQVTGLVRHGTAGTAAAILLAEWLQDRLAARIELEECDHPDGCPESVRLQFDGNTIQVGSSPTCLTMNASTEAECFLPLRLPRSRRSDGGLLAAAIDIA